MPESAKVIQSIESFKAYLSEALQGKDAVVIGEDKNIYLAGIVGIVQEVADGLLPIYIGRTALQLAKIKTKIAMAEIDALWVFDNKHNLTDDEPRGKQLVFDWELKDGSLLVSSSYSLVGKIRHRGFQS
jgi:hypothetical protein